MRDSHQTRIITAMMSKSTLMLCLVALLSCKRHEYLDETYEVLAVTGPPNLSFGWDEISVKTELGDLIEIKSDAKTGLITQFMISGSTELNIDPGRVSRIGFPDFRTLNDVWYSGSTYTLELIRFEFLQLRTNRQVKSGRFEATFFFDGARLDGIHMCEYSDKGICHVIE